MRGGEEVEWAALPLGDPILLQVGHLRRTFSAIPALHAHRGYRSLQELLDAAFQDAVDAQTEMPLAHIAAFLAEAEAERMSGAAGRLKLSARGSAKWG